MIIITNANFSSQRPRDKIQTETEFGTVSIISGSFKSMISLSADLCH